MPAITFGSIFLFRLCWWCHGNQHSVWLNGLAARWCCMASSWKGTKDHIWWCVRECNSPHCIACCFCYRKSLTWVSNPGYWRSWQCWNSITVSSLWSICCSGKIQFNLCVLHSFISNSLVSQTQIIFVLGYAIVNDWKAVPRKSDVSFRWLSLS